MSAYLYIDNRTICAPFGCVSLSEIEYASKKKLNGCEWSVYLTIVCIVSGRPNEDGVKIGLNQLIKNTGFSKSQIYKAVKKLNAINLIETKKHKHLLKNPESNRILDEAIEKNSNIKSSSELLTTIKENNKNLLLITCEEPVNNLKKSLEFEKNNSKNESRIGDHAMSLYNYNSNSNYLGGKKDESLFRIIIPYLELHFNSYQYTAREQLLDRYPEEKITAVMIQNWTCDFWLNHSHEIADTLTNKRPEEGSNKPKTCLLYQWGWGYSTSSNTVRKWVVQYAKYRQI